MLLDGLDNIPNVLAISASLAPLFAASPASTTGPPISKNYVIVLQRTVGRNSTGPGDRQRLPRTGNNNSVDWGDARPLGPRSSCTCPPAPEATILWNGDVHVIWA